MLEGGRSWKTSFRSSFSDVDEQYPKKIRLLCFVRLSTRLCNIAKLEPASRSNNQCAQQLLQVTAGYHA
jgi:hypothetical protein